MILYKYFKSKYKKDFQDGVFYLNTFSEIKKYDTCGAIGDPEEARARNSFDKINISGFQAQNYQAELSALRNEMGINIQGRFGQLGVSGCQSIRDLPNAYIFCGALERNDEYWAQPERKYSECIKILNRQNLAERLHHKLNEMGVSNKCLGNKCFYESNMGLATSGSVKIKYPDYFRKRLEFMPQKEHRLVFLPKKGGVLEPIKVKIKIDDLIELI